MFSKNTNIFFNTCSSLGFLFVHYGKPIPKLKSRNTLVEERNTSFEVTVLETVKKEWFTDK
jgi:hypothetical protein